MSSVDTVRDFFRFLNGRRIMLIAVAVRKNEKKVLQAELTRLAGSGSIQANAPVVERDQNPKVH